ELRLGPDELNPIRERLDALVGAVDARRAVTAATTVADDRVLEEAQQVGGMLLDLVVPQPIQIEFRVPGLYLEIGIDEKLVEYPWELMFDGEEFLCLRHEVGRFVNASTISRTLMTTTQRQDDRIRGVLNMLLISVPQPQPRPKRTYKPLPAAK